MVLGKRGDLKTVPFLKLHHTGDTTGSQTTPNSSNNFMSISRYIEHLNKQLCARLHTCVYANPRVYVTHKYIY